LPDEKNDMSWEKLLLFQQCRLQVLEHFHIRQQTVPRQYRQNKEPETSIRQFLQFDIRVKLKGQ
jgi:hypothetical protein